MKKIAKYILLILLLTAFFWCGALFADKQSLQDNLIRLHVVANSDSEEDQRRKLQVRDAVTAYLQPAMAELTDQEQAKAYLKCRLDDIETVANQVLQKAGTEDRAVVSLSLEAFDTRSYDTFTLPAGVYESLRIQIGSGEGHNWWCVVFPSLCLPATADGFQDTAVSSGFDDTLVNTLSGEDGYEIRFFILDCIGRVENFLYWK